MYPRIMAEIGDIIPYLVIGGFISLFVAVWVIGGALARKRREELAAWCQQHDFEFSGERYDRMDSRYPAIQCLQNGRSRYAFNIISGTWDGQNALLAFDYHYVTGSGKHRQTHYLSVVILGVPFDLKPLVIRPENILDRMAAFFGYEDIDLEDSPEFSRRFHVKSPDPQWARQVLCPGLVDLLMQSSKYSVQMDGPLVVVWQGRQIPPREFDEAIAFASGLVERLPQEAVGPSYPAAPIPPEGE